MSTYSHGLSRGYGGESEKNDGDPDGCAFCTTVGVGTGASDALNSLFVACGVWAVSTPPVTSVGVGGPNTRLMVFGDSSFVT